jgi:transposase
MHGGIKRGNLHFIEGSVNKHACVNILRERLKASAEKRGFQVHFAFYHDSDPKYSSHLVRGWCLYVCPKVIKTPPQSPDLNVIENLLAKLETEIRNHSISNKGDLKKTLREEWERISPKYTHTKTARIHSKSFERSHCKQRIANVVLKEICGMRD